MEESQPEYSPARHRRSKAEVRWTRVGAWGEKCSLKEWQALTQFAGEKLMKVKCPEPNWQGPVCTHKRWPVPVEVHRTSLEASTSRPFPLLTCPSFLPSLHPSPQIPVNHPPEGGTSRPYPFSPHLPRRGTEWIPPAYFLWGRCQVFLLIKLLRSASTPDM